MHNQFLRVNAAAKRDFAVKMLFHVFGGHVFGKRLNRMNRVHADVNQILDNRINRAAGMMNDFQAVALRLFD